MKFLKLIGSFLLCFMLSLQGCSLLCRSDCRQVEYIKVPCRAACGTFPKPCPYVKFPGFYKPDLTCLENLRRFTALRQRGVGVIVLGDRLRFILPADLLFTRDSMRFCAPVDINDCYVAILADIGEIIRCIPCVPVIVTGHTDDVGKRSELFRRSYAMAQAVAGHLWAQGIDWNRVRIFGRADCEPIASNESVFGSTDNRRVEIRLDFSRNYIFNGRYNNIYCPDCLGDRHR
jgi:outer membrane protein OmpA-like peptidoglycan-associated protein